MRLIIKGITTLFLYTIGFLIIIPITIFIPKKKNRICFIGRDNGLFLDNTKYLFLHLLNHEDIDSLDIFFLTEDIQTYELLKKNNLSVEYYPSIRSFIKLIRSNILIADNYHWIFNLKYFLLYFSFKIQLWHGVGFKKLGRTLVYDKNELPLKKKIVEFFGLYLEQLLPNYDIFISTSEFYSNKVFKPAFRMKEVLETGYPRNDVLFNKDKYLNNMQLINSDLNAIDTIGKLKESDHKLILYAPTYRESKNLHLKKINKDLSSLIQFGNKNKIKFVFKSHPDHLSSFLSDNEDVINYKYDRDIYPILPMFDLLITDYSSIYMDYLLLDKPVIFYPYDFDVYIKKSRNIQFDYNWITPGPKCYTEKDLIESVKEILFNNVDNYKNEREEILNIAFKNKDNKSSKRLWDHIENNLFSQY